MKKEYVFMITTGSGRCNIHAGFKVLNYEMILEYLKGNKKISGWFAKMRYAKIGESANLLKHMTLIEFEECFDPSIFTDKQITSYFRKEISEKYGLHKAQKLMKRIPKKELELGRCYLNEKGKTEWYFGKVKISHFKPERLERGWYNREHKVSAETLIFEGILHWNNWYNYKQLPKKLKDVFIRKRKGYKDKDDECFNYENPIKSVRKLVKETENKVEMYSTFKMTLANGEKLEIEFLDYKGENKEIVYE